jgi:hypothetical protein
MDRADYNIEFNKVHFAWIVILIGKTEEGWNNFYIILYIPLKNSPTPVIFTFEHSQFHEKTKVIKIN